MFSLPDEDRRGSLALARDFARRTATTFGYLGNHDDVVLVVSELATNAVCHGSGRPIVRIVGGQVELLVEVVDDNTASPAVRDGGFGIRLVQELSTCWGVAARDGQKVVWCELTA